MPTTVLIFSILYSSDDKWNRFGSPPIVLACPLGATIESLGGFHIDCGFSVFRAPSRSGYHGAAGTVPVESLARFEGGPPIRRRTCWPAVHLISEHGANSGGDSPWQTRDECD
jgi:hypothetical protein